MSPINPEQPPLPPQVVAQQGGPNGMMQFAQGLSGSGEAFPNGMQAAANVNSSQLAAQELSVIEQSMGKLTPILASSNPELLTYLKVMAEAGKQLVAALQQQNTDQSQGEQPAPPQGGMSSSSADMSAMAAGGA